MTTAQPNIQALLSHQDWVRALARSLVADPSRADDVAQQTLLEAMTNPPRDLSRPQGWLRQVARNAARALARQESRRRRREQAVAQSVEVHADPAETAHRAAAHKRLVDALFELEEPYHTVVLLRFFEDLEARDIAAQLDRPVATVRTQLARGLERMRQRLDREHGDRDAWCAALLPLFADKQAVVSVPILTLGAFVMTKWILPAAAILLALLVGYAVFDGYSATAPAIALPSESVRAAQVPAPPVGDAPQRDAVAAAATAADEPTPTALPTTGVAGRVVTVDGSPVPGLVIAWRDPKMPRLVGTTLWYGNTGMDLDQPALRRQLSDPRAVRFFARSFAPYEKIAEALILGQPLELPRATTDGLGRFHIADGKDTANLQLEGTDWICYGNGRLADDDEAIVVAGPAVHVAGRVVDATGTPIEGAYVSMGFSLASLPGVAQQFEQSSSYRSWNANTDAAGAFDLGVLPAHPQLEITAQKRGYVAIRVAPPDVVGPVTWTLNAEPAAQRRVLSGRVRHADGSVAALACLRFGSDGGEADDNGRFEFELGSVDVRAPLTAYLPGLQPAVVEGLGPRLRADPAVGRDLELTLGPPTLQISGRVVSADGAPLAGVRVLLADGTPHGTFFGSLESWMANQSEDGERTDVDGRFTLRELSDRRYTVRAIDDASLLVIESDPVAAGSVDLELRAPAQPFQRRLEGVVVDRLGVPVADARIRVMTRLHRALNGARLLFRDRPATTDEQGRFVLEDCPRRHVTLAIGGPELQDHEVEVPTDGQPLRIVVTRMLRFTVVRSTSTAADHFEVRDESDNRIVTTAHRPGVTSADYRIALPAGDSPVFAVADRATDLVLFAGDREVGRVALHLRQGRLNRVEL